MGTLEHGGPRGGDQGGIEQFLIGLRNEIALTCGMISGNRNSVGALFAITFEMAFATAFAIAKAVPTGAASLATQRVIA